MFSTAYFFALVIGAIIISLLLAAMLPLTTHYWRRFLSWKEDVGVQASDPAPASESGAQALKALLSRLQCEYTSIGDKADESETDVAFDFQGGHFIGSIDHDKDNPLAGTLSISYFACLSAPLAEANLLNRVVNEINLITLPPKATITPASDDAEVDGALNVNLHISGIRLIADERGEAMLRALLTSCFHVQRVASDRLNELRRTEPDETMQNSIPDYKAVMAIAAAELRHYADSPFAGPWYETPDWTLEEVVRRLFGRELSGNLALVVNGTPAAADTDIAAYRVFDILTGNPDAAKNDIATIDVINHDQPELSLHLLLTMRNVSEQLLLVHVDALAPGLPVNSYRSFESAETRPEIHRTVVGIYRGDPEQFRAEAEFMAQEEGLVQRCCDGDAAYSLYWGRVLFADGRLLEAEHYLRNAWSIISRQILLQTDDLPQELKESFEDVAFFLGQLYYQLGRYFESEYYLDIILLNQRLLPTKQHILTLQALDDPRVPYMLDNLREIVTMPGHGDDDEENEEPTDPATAELLEFIERQKIVIEIRRGNIEKARTALRRILESNPDSEFALSWLKKISA